MTPYAAVHGVLAMSLSRWSTMCRKPFGLTPVEAMAAGLPVVVSDWDGYRDTVRHGVDGIRIPTLQSPPACGDILVDRYAADIDSYDVYLARTTYNVVVDVDVTAQAFTALINDPALRKRMGEAGRARAIALYDWQKVLASYEDLAGKLADIRKAAPEPEKNIRRVWPSRLSPFEMFANYPTRTPQPTDRIRVVVTDVEAALAGIRLDSNALIDDIEVLMTNLRDFIAAIGTAEVELSALLAKQNVQGRMQIIALVLRLAKFGIVSVTPAEGRLAVRGGPSDVKLQAAPVQDQ